MASWNDKIQYRDIGAGFVILVMSIDIVILLIAIIRCLFEYADTTMIGVMFCNIVAWYLALSDDGKGIK